MSNYDFISTNGGQLWYDACCSLPVLQLAKVFPVTPDTCRVLRPASDGWLPARNGVRLSVPGFETRLQCAPKIRSSRKGPINVCILIKHENYRWSNSVWQPVSISKVSVSKKHGFTFIRNKIYLVWNLLRLFSSTDIYYVLNHEKFLSFLTKHKHHVEINARKEANG